MEFLDLMAFAGVCLLISSFFGMLIFRTVFETVNTVLFFAGLVLCAVSIGRFQHSENEYVFWFSWFWGIIGGIVLSATEWLLERWFFWGSIPRVTHKSLFFAFLYAQVFILIYGLFLFCMYGSLFYDASVIRFELNDKMHTCWRFSCEKSNEGYCFRAIDTDGKCLVKKLLPQEEKMINFQLATYAEIDFNPHEDFIVYFEYGQAGFVTREKKTLLEKSLSRNVLKNYLETLVH